MRDAFVPAAIICSTALMGLLVLGSNYALFHTLMEVTVAAVAFVVFSIAWHTRRFASSDYVTFIGMASLPIGVVTLLHALSYKGLHLFGQSSNLPTQLWIIARVIQAFAFLFAAYYLPNRMSRPGGVLALFTGSAMVAVAAAFTGFFPDAYIDGRGLTAFKIYTEYVVIAVTLLAAANLFVARRRLPRRVVALLIGSMGATVIAEMLFTLYSDPFGMSNQLGHVAHIAAFALIYTALVETSLEEPLGVIFRDLKQREVVLSNAYEREHAIAETLQDAMEMETESVEGLRVGHQYRPAPGTGRIGGDFYDVVRLSSTEVAFTIGDVCGKGIGAAMTAMKSRSALRALAQADPEPAAVLQRMNAHLRRELADESFVTAVYGTLDLTTGRVRLVSAGHPSPVICGRPHEMPTEDEMSPPLGVLDALEPTVWETVLMPGETIVLYTDGVLDAPGPDDRFGQDRLRDVLHSFDCSITTDKLVKTVMHALREHTGGGLTDDVAVVALRYEGLPMERSA